MASTSMYPISATRVITGFTTSGSTQSTQGGPLAHILLEDSALGVHKISKGTSHKLVTTHDHTDERQGDRAWEAFFPKGSINPGNKNAPMGGFGFYMSGGESFAKALKDSTGRGEVVDVVMGYEVLFEEGWEWGKGGKLPGIYGGVGEAAYGCTGGRQTSRCQCFNLRLMWRENGVGELYAYLPHHPSNTRACLSPTVPVGSRAKSIEHDDWGFSVGRGAWTFEKERWVTIGQRVRIGTGKEDGEIEVFIDGKSVLEVKGLVFCTTEDGELEQGTESRVHGMHFQTFFGGHTSDWAAPKDQRAWFRNIQGAVLRVPA